LRQRADILNGDFQILVTGQFSSGSWRALQNPRPRYPPNELYPSRPVQELARSRNWAGGPDPQPSPFSPYPENYSPVLPKPHGSRQTSTQHKRRDAAMAMAPPPACSLFLRVAAAAPSSVTSSSVLSPRGPGLLPSPRPASARRHLTAAWSSRAAASASVEIQDDYADEMDAVNIAQDVTQVHGRFPSLPFSPMLCIVIWVCGDDDSESLNFLVK
jgi:hypothetical protein